MNKILKQSFSLSRKYLTQKAIISSKEIQFCSAPLDLSVDKLTPIEMSIKICGQLDPNNLLQLYNRYSDQYTEKHILQSLKITAKMLGLYYFKQEETEIFKKMIRHFNQFLPGLNNLDLADYLFWYRKFQNEWSLAQYLQNVDKEALKQAIQSYIQQRIFLPRQLNMIYECIELIFPKNEELLQEFVQTLFQTNALTATQLMQFLGALNKKFAMTKTMDLFSIVMFLRYSENFFYYDVDQVANIIRSVATLRLYLFISEKSYLEFMDKSFKITIDNLTYLESGPLLNLLSTKKYLPRNSDFTLYHKIHEQVKQFATKIDLEFLIEYIGKTLDFDYCTKEDRDELIELSILKIAKNPKEFEMNQLAFLMIKLGRINENYISFVRTSLNELQIQNYTGQYLSLMYLHYICKEDISKYLKIITKQCKHNNDEDIKVSKLCATNLISLYDEYQMKCPDILNTIFFKQSYLNQIKSLGQSLYKSQRMQTLYIGKVLQLKVDYQKTDHLKFWGSFLSYIHTQEEALILSKWVSSQGYEFLNLILPQLFVINDNDDVTLPQAIFLHQVITKNLAHINIDIVIHGIIYSDKLLEYLIEYDQKIVNKLFKYSYKYNDGLGTALLIQLLEEKVPEKLVQFSISTQLLQSYKLLKEYDGSFILLMIKYNCLPIRDCLKIYNNLINFTVNELRLFILYLAMSNSIGIQQTATHIQQQIKKLNETYVIQIK